MTHSEIFTKFMIEYDKANVTSSYPSLTEYEVATVLDKAYMALIAQKVTGNNIRRAPLEADVKSVSDLQPLITTINIPLAGKDNNPFTRMKGYPYMDKDMDDDQFGKKYEEVIIAGGLLRSMPDNVRSCELPEDFLYFVSAGIPTDMHEVAGTMNDMLFNSDKDGTIKPIDNKDYDYNSNKFKRFRFTPAHLTSHQIAEKFFATSYNIPWVKNPMCYIEDNMMFVVVDPVVGIPNIYYVPGYDDKLTVKYKYPDNKTEKTEELSNGVFIPAQVNKNSLVTVYCTINGDIINVQPKEWASLTYIKMPHTFVKDLNDDHFAGRTDVSYFNPGVNNKDDEWYQFELNDIMAEELISLAITYALENVESQRLTSHVNLRGLES